MTLPQIHQDLLDDTPLCPGQLIGQPAQERSGQFPTRIMGEPSGLLGLFALAQRQCDFET